MIVTITLNPALDRILFLREYVPNRANRVVRRENCIGGKGAHVSYNLANLGMTSLATGIAMGENGRRAVGMLTEAGVTCGFLLGDEGETRINDVIIEEGGACTLLCERGPALSEQTRRAFLALFSGLVFGASFVVISGDASNYEGEAGTAFFRALLAACQDAGAKVILDMSGRLLREGAALSPYLIKPNAAELAELTGLPADTEEEVAAAIRALDAYHLPVVAVSMGGDGSIVRWENALYRVPAVRVGAANTVGCGDAFLTGLVYGLEQGLSPEACLAMAAACGGAEAENPLTVGLDPDRVRALAERVDIIKMEG